MHSTYMLLQVQKGHLNELRDAKAALNKQLGLVGSIKQVQALAKLSALYPVDVM